MNNTLSSQLCRGFKAAAGSELFAINSQRQADCRSCRYFSGRNCGKHINVFGGFDIT